MGHGHAHHHGGGHGGGHGGHRHGAHGHGHGGHHGHAPTDFGRRFQIAIGLNVAIVIVQAVYGTLANSMALLADAGHNLSDVLGLIVAYAATRLAARPATSRFTYGLGSSSILAALFNACFLLLAVGALSWEAIRRLADPQPMQEVTVMVVAGIGMVLNGFTAWLFASGGKSDINLRGAFLHMAADAAVSAGVIVAALLVLLTGWVWLDPLTSLAINAVILAGTWSLLRQSLSMSLAAVPPGIDYAAVRDYLAGLPGVSGLHDLHVWPLSTTETALTVHLVMPEGHPGDGGMAEIAGTLAGRFSIDHPTLQVETGQGATCALALRHAV